MLNVVLIIIGSILLFLVYSNLSKNIESYAVGRLASFNDTLSNENALIDQSLSGILESRNLLDEHTRMNLFDSMVHNMSLINSFKILQEANKKTRQTMNLYDICFKNNNPCNKYCVELEPKYCKIKKN